MRRLHLTNRAIADLGDIALYIVTQSGSRVTSDRFDTKLRAQCRKLAELPFTQGAARDELRPGLRSVPFQNYVIFFRYLEDMVEIVSILEGHRDIATQISE